jgi:hypothetical protein
MLFLGGDLMVTALCAPELRVPAAMRSARNAVAAKAGNWADQRRLSLPGRIRTPSDDKLNAVAAELAAAAYLAQHKTSPQSGMQGGA